MGKVIVLLAVLFVAFPVYALDLDISGDYYITPNAGNNYEDAYGVSLTLEQVLKSKLALCLEGSHITDINFPVVDDPKGDFGNLRGYGLMVGPKLTFPIQKGLELYLRGMSGVYMWDFKENPFLQDNKVKVEVEESLAFKAGLGLTYKVNTDVSLSFEGGWFDTDIPKDARDDKGRAWNILDDSNIGLQYIYVQAKVTVKF